ncbi:hypothetical protein D3C80_1783730 [compost metagenome]
MSLNLKIGRLTASQGSSSVAAWVAATGANSRLAQTQAWVIRSITPAPILCIDVSPSDFTVAGALARCLRRRQYKGSLADKHLYTLLLNIL